jgi:Threonine aldolase
VGSSEFIARAHRWRKMFGGGMRQAGIIAAGGLFAIENHIDRLGDDHARARRLAEAVNAMEGFTVDLDSVQTNMVYVDGDLGAKQIMAGLAEHGVDVLDVGPTAVRAVVHLHITDDDIERTISAFAAL